MLQGISKDDVDDSSLNDALSMLSSKFNLDSDTLSDVKSMATRLLGGESIDAVLNESAAPEPAPKTIESKSNVEDEFKDIFASLSAMMSMGALGAPVAQSNSQKTLAQSNSQKTLAQSSTTSESKPTMLPSKPQPA